MGKKNKELIAKNKSIVEQYPQKVGAILQTCNGLCECICYRSYSDCDFKFTDDNYIVHHRSFIDFLSESIINPYHRSIFGVGYFGEGIKTKLNPDIYYSWYEMLKRCYKEDDSNRGNLLYKHVCTVDEEWHNFQNYYHWYVENLREYNVDEKPSIDKDLLIIGNKSYGPDKCVMLPMKLNNFIAHINTNKKSVYPPGVSYVSNKKNKYRAYSSNQITNKNDYLGSYSTPEEAFWAFIQHKNQMAISLANKYDGLISSKAIEALKEFDYLKRYNGDWKVKVIKRREEDEH